MSIRRLLRSSLRERGYRVSVAATGEEGLDLAASDPVAVVILDLGLPDMDGAEVCRQLRSWNNMPIIVLSARDLGIDLARRHVTRGDEDVRLTPTEYELLTALATQSGRVLTHSWLLQHIW